jgi:hypothetical protein
MNDWPRREPESFAQGDTLCWRRTLSKYPSGAGWLLEYSLAGGVQPIKFFSTPDADGVSHCITVPSPVTSQWLPQQYILLGDALLPAADNNGVPEQHQIYEAPCAVTVNAVALPGNVDLRSNAEKALAQAWATFNQLNADFLERSRNGETEFDRRRIESAWKMVVTLEEKVRYEKGHADARMRKPNRNKIRNRFLVTPVIGLPGYFTGPGYPPGDGFY